ncbi:MAG: LamG-like jellyroll fold domain-containing protein [Granulosicoccus sp.]
MKNSIKRILLPVLVLLSVVSADASAAPGGVDPSARRLWLDASDIDGDGISGNDPAHGAGVATWVDKSGNGNNATPVSGQATFDSNTAETINGNTAVLFWNTPYDTGFDLRPVTTPDATIFSVYVQKEGSGQQSPWGINNGDWDGYFYPVHSGFGVADDGVFGATVGGNVVESASVLDETYLLTATFSHLETDGSSVYFDGNKISDFTDSSDATNQISTLRLGHDGDNGDYRGQLAEFIVYDRVLTSCEIQAVNKYLDDKYGKVFGNPDADGDGGINCLDNDADGDGIPNSV